MAEFIGSGTETDEEINADMAKKTRPWSTWEYERVRLAAKDVLNSLEPVPMSGKMVYVVDGKARWELMGAIDRANERADGQTGHKKQKKS